MPRRPRSRVERQPPPRTARISRVTERVAHHQSSTPAGATSQAGRLRPIREHIPPDRPQVLMHPRILTFGTRRANGAEMGPAQSRTWRSFPRPLIRLPSHPLISAQPYLPLLQSLCFLLTIRICFLFVPSPRPVVAICILYCFVPFSCCCSRFVLCFLHLYISHLFYQHSSHARSLAFSSYEARNH